jgi:multiple sugar transport system substrate-binding protein
MNLKRLLALTAMWCGLAGGHPALAEDITLQMVVWNYSLDTIQDNLKKFEQQNPGIKVQLTDYPWTEYENALVLRMRNKTPTDVIYGGQDWLPAWAAAGFLAPLDDVAPDQIPALKKDLAGFAVSDVTYKGKVYGLPYYADTISFLYNKKMLDDAGIAVPKTWEDVTAAAEKLKAGGLEFPIAYEYNADLPNFYDQFIAGVYSRGGDMFDKDLNPLFADPQSAAFKQLQWIQDINKKGLVFNEPQLSNIVTAMGNGKHAFVVCYNYILAALNNSAEQSRAGQFALAPMPGEMHQTFGFAKFYAITAAAAADPARRDASWKLVNFMAGPPYTIAKRWAVEKGLGFGQLPLLEDKDVLAAWGKWVDMPTLRDQITHAKVGTWTEWTAVWAAQFRPLLAEGMVGQASVEDVMKTGADKWNALKAKMKKD